MKHINKNLAIAFTLLCSSLPFMASAQESSSSTSVKVTEEVEFNPHWFMQLQVGGGYTVGETDFKHLVSPAAAVNVGYKFSPLFGLRVGASGWQAKGAWVSPMTHYKFNYVQGNVDAMLSLTNLFCGYNPYRTLDFYGFVGVGGAVGFHNNEANAIAAQGYHFEHLWSGKRAFIAGRAGLGVDINLNKCVALNLEANANLLPDHFNSKKGKNSDWQFNGLVGVTISFGKTKTKVIETVETVEVVEQPQVTPAPQPAPAPAPEPAPVEVKKPQPLKEDIFFTINSSKISEKESVKINELIEYLKANPEAKVSITGYADKGTGNATYNMKLSKFRAQSVADALRKGGIDTLRISVDAEGDTEQPFRENDMNRVAIAIAK
ncbi:OmpA family protein [uncultured Duncaniella sp.]|uniref:OmpA family protein n=1 Tax=uncultured Duncaniella sp. TaxID=2768039 RepID=UPI002676E2E7|nr:OmpA family protein [uncultured Duncaniella sp.]MCI9171662.1 OmpA family protein [Muribaculaceae bacterium]